VTEAKARKPKGGADDCLATEHSGLKADLMAQVLARANLQRAWREPRCGNATYVGTSPGESRSAGNRRDDRRAVPGLRALAAVGHPQAGSATGDVPTAAGPTGVHPEGQRRSAPPGHPHRGRPRDPAA
jgi:hypothetical protein